MFLVYLLLYKLFFGVVENYFLKQHGVMPS